MKLKLLLVLLLCSCLGFSQKAYLDSLWKTWSNTSESDTNRLKAMYDFAWDGYLFTQPDSSYYYSKQMLAFAKQKKQPEYEAKALNLQFNYYLAIGDFGKAMEKNNEGFAIRKQLNDKLGMAVTNSNYGILYQIQGDYSKAIDYYTSSLTLNEEVHNEQGVATSLHNIGHLYQEQFNTTKALEFYEKSLALREKINDQGGVAESNINIGSLYQTLGDYEKALAPINKSLSIFKAMGNQPGTAAALGNLGMIYFELKEYDKAYAYHSQCLKIQEEMGNKQTMAISYLNIGSVYMAQNKRSEAIDYCSKALHIDQEIGDVSGIRNASKMLYRIYKEGKQYDLALQMHELYIQMLDSINSEESKKEIVRQEFKYAYEKKAAADSVKSVEQKKVVAAQLKQEQTRRYALYGGLALLLLFGGFMYSRFKVTQRQKDIIEKQKNMVEEKQEEILDSIQYAQRIQRSLLPSESYIERQLKRLKKN